MVKLHEIAGRVFSLTLGAAAVILLVGGAKLLTLGGSWWYAAAGAVLLASAVLLWRRSRWGAWLYGLLLVITFVWSLWEVGFDAWALLARLDLLVAGGLWLLTPLAFADLRPSPKPLIHPRARWRVWVGIAVATIVLTGAALIDLRPPFASGSTPSADAPGRVRDWRYYGNDANGSRYSPLAQILPENVARLTLAWSARTGDPPAPGGTFEATPLQVGRLVYLCTPRGKVLALNAANGQQVWQFDPTSNLAEQNSGPCRGVSYGEPDASALANRAPRSACAQRIYSATPDNRLWALDALTGKPCANFGHDGSVDLREGLGDVPKGSYNVTSPPLYTHGRLVVGAAVADTAVDNPSGVVRAFDADSGELAWAWDVGRPERAGAPGPGETYTRSTPNVWAQMVADDAAGLIYLPTGNPSADYYGSRRREFDQAFGSSLVAVEADTGKTRWKFQSTHHDVWDFDLSSQPTLVDMPGPQGMQPAVAFGSKSGSIYVLNRLTGEPIVPVVEKPVPHDTAVESGLSTTQPESALRVNPGPERLSEAAMWGITPFDQMWCRIRFREARYEGPYTPLGTDRESIIYPGSFGGVEWGGLAVDPVRRVLIANPSAMPFRMRLARIGTPAASVKGFWEMPGTGYSVSVYGFLSPLAIPCMQPPWGGLFAIDLGSQRILWRRSVGSAVDSGPRGIGSHLPFLIGTPQIGGAIITRSGLVFSAATMDRYLRAYALESGRELWKARLPAGGQATPMTYEFDGRQYVVIAAGGHGRLETKTGDYVLAWALPGSTSSIIGSH